MNIINSRFPVLQQATGKWFCTIYYAGLLVVILKSTDERNESTQKSAAKYLICSYLFKFDGHMNDLLS
jgi:hypothetical protein